MVFSYAQGGTRLNTFTRLTRTNATIAPQNEPNCVMPPHHNSSFRPPSRRSIDDIETRTNENENAMITAVVIYKYTDGYTCRSLSPDSMETRGTAKHERRPVCATTLFTDEFSADTRPHYYTVAIMHACRVRQCELVG